MKKLDVNALGVSELNENEMIEIGGGGLIDLIVDALIDYVKRKLMPEIL
jgi:hypothetical protein